MCTKPVLMYLILKQPGISLPTYWRFIVAVQYLYNAEQLGSLANLRSEGYFAQQGPSLYSVSFKVLVLLRVTGLATL